MSRENTVFASNTLIEHIFRGIIGGLALFFSFELLNTHPWVSVLLIIITFFAFRGCPMCWAIGVFQTGCKIKKRQSKKL